MKVIVNTVVGYVFLFVLIAIFQTLNSEPIDWTIRHYRAYLEIESYSDSLKNYYRQACAIGETKILKVDVGDASFTDCEKFLLCNSTICIVLNYASQLWTSLYLRDNLNDTTLNAYKDFIPFHHDVEKLFSNSPLVLTDASLLKDFPLKKKIHEISRRHLPTFGYNFELLLRLDKVRNTTFVIEHALKNICSDRKAKNYVISGIGKLPNGCSNIILCSEDLCREHSIISSMFVDLLERDSTNVKSECLIEEPSIKNNSRKTRAPAFKHIQTNGLLRFNLPGYR